MGLKIEKLWNYLGKISLVIGIIIGLFTLVSKCENDHKLVAIGYQNEFKVPEASYFQLDSLYETTKPQNDPKADSSKTFDQRLEEICKGLEEIQAQSENTGQIYYKQISSQKSLFHIYLKNTGKKELDSLVLHIPGNGYYKIITPIEKFDAFNSIINLGSLRPTDKIELLCWTDMYFLYIDESGNYYSYKHENIKITFPDGSTRVDFPATVFGLWKWCSEYAFFSLLIGIILIPLIILLVLVYTSSKNDKDNSEIICNDTTGS